MLKASTDKRRQVMLVTRRWELESKKVIVTQALVIWRTYRGKILHTGYG
jgi:hypothetical protein